jgi:transposase-like protein
MPNAFDAPHFTNDDEARKLIEKIRWPSGPICPHCGVIDHAYATSRDGLYRCAESECRKDFSVTTGTVMERSKIPLRKWMMGFYLMCASKKGMSAHQLHRALGIAYQSAWFMCHRIREAMRDGGLAPMGGGGKIVEVDETYHGKIEGPQKHSRKRYNWKPTRGRTYRPGRQAAYRCPRRAWRAGSHIPCRGCRQRDGPLDHGGQHRPRDPAAY